jgi:hypothetical protein
MIMATQHLQIDSLTGLREIPHSAWIIKSGNRSYIFSGIPAHARNARDVIAALPENAGRSAKIHKVV